MKEAVYVAVQLKSDKLKEEAQAENQDFINSLDSNMTKIIKQQVKAQTSKIMSKLEKYVTDTLGAEFNTRDDDVTPAREAQDGRKWHPSNSPTPDREWHLTKTVIDQPPQPWITHLAQAVGSQASFDEFMATPIDFYAFMMNQLKIDYLTQELLTGPTYDLMKGSCKSVPELEYQLEEVFKAINDQLDWNNPEGMPYPHDLSKPLPLHLEEITVQRQDDEIYKFQEGDFKRLRRQDIEDMLLLLV
ncbi:hypothetical protein Tco_0441110 [Tanacetum coccineum]